MLVSRYKGSSASLWRLMQRLDITVPMSSAGMSDDHRRFQLSIRPSACNDDLYSQGQVGTTVEYSVEDAMLGEEDGLSAVMMGKRITLL